MPNNFWRDDINSLGTAPSRKAPSPGMASGKTPAVNEKPAFPTATLPGPTQGKDRSGGVKKVQRHPKSMGI